MGKERSKNVLAVKQTQPLHIVCSVMIGCVLTVSMPTSEFAWPRTISWHPWKRLLQIKVCMYVIAVFPSYPDIIVLVDWAENTKLLTCISQLSTVVTQCMQFIHVHVHIIFHKKARGLGMWPLLHCHKGSHTVFGGFISIYWLLCKELVMAEPGPRISMQCIATHYCCLGVLAGVTVSND